MNYRYSRSEVGFASAGLRAQMTLYKSPGARVTARIRKSAKTALVQPRSFPAASGLRESCPSSKQPVTRPEHVTRPPHGLSLSSPLLTSRKFRNKKVDKIGSEYVNAPLSGRAKNPGSSRGRILPGAPDGGATRPQPVQAEASPPTRACLPAQNQSRLPAGSSLRQQSPRSPRLSTSRPLCFH